jgi:hypothetical protein
MGSAQCILNGVWLLLRLPMPDYVPVVDYDKRTYIVYNFCEAFEEGDMAIAFVLPFVLLLLTLGYAFMARKIPGRFNETRYVLITTCRCVRRSINTGNMQHVHRVAVVHPDLHRHQRQPDTDARVRVVRRARTQRVRHTHVHVRPARVCGDRAAAQEHQGHSRLYPVCQP